jgi:predicted dehydrogenase
MVYAKSRSLAGSGKTEGSSDVLMTLTGGATAYFLCTFELAAPGFPRSQFAYRAICEKGLLDVDAYGEARASVAGGDWETIAVQEKIDWQGKGFLDPVRLEAYIAHVKDFVISIREKRPPQITGWDGRQAVAAALAAYESSKTGKEIILTR